MKTYNVALLGASGVVGQEILRILEEIHFPINQIKCLASKKSSGKPLTFNHQTIFIEEATPNSFQNMDLVFGAVSREVSAYFAPYILHAKALYIDNSSVFRNVENVPLVIPEINEEDCFHHQGIIANPNCSTIIACMALYPIHLCSSLKSIVVSTYQAVSGAGLLGMNELIQQMHDSCENKRSVPQVFHYPIVGNTIPLIGQLLEDHFTDEERKLQNESRKIFHLPQLQVTCTCVRVPVLRCHSMSITCQTEEEIELNSLEQQFLLHPKCQLVDCPMPINTSNQDIITVGRLRKNSQGISLWCCGDQLRKGAATNAVQIAQFCHEKDLITPMLV